MYNSCIKPFRAIRFVKLLVYILSGLDMRASLICMVHIEMRNMLRL